MATVFPMENKIDEEIEEGDPEDSGLDDPRPMEGYTYNEPPAPDPVAYTDPPGGGAVIVARDIELLQCARNGYVEETRRLLENPAVLSKIDERDDEGLTPLHYAARYNHFEIVKLLIENGAEIDCEDDEDMTPLHYACRIKRKRRKSSKSRALLDEIEDSPRRKSLHKRPSVIATVGGKHIDPDSTAIHYLIQHGANIRHKDVYDLTALHHAAMRGDEVACENLLEYHSDLVNARDNQRMTPLHTAACKGEHDIARQLIRAGADLFSKDDEESTALHEAATVGDTKIARLIFDACKTDGAFDQDKLTRLLEDKDEDWNTPMMLGVESGRFKFVELCIKKGSNVNTTNKWYMTALHLAAIKGDVRCVKLLIEKGARISAVNHEHQTPLHKAALFNNTQCIEALLIHGADIEAKDKDNFTPLLLAACYGHAESVQLLLARGANVHVEDKNDRTAIYLAAEENKLVVLERLLTHPLLKNMINDTDENGNGPLHIAASLGHIRIVRALLNSGADLYCKNDMEQTPIHLAARNGWNHVVRDIVSKEKNAMTDGDEDSNTALHLAAISGHVKLVETLLMMGAEPEIRNSSLRTALSCAAMNGNLKVVKLLLASDAVIDPVDKTKMTPLLLAADHGSAEVVEYLIERKADVTAQDSEGNNCLDLAINNDHVEVALEIIKSDQWKQALRHHKMEKDVLTTPLRKLIKKMPEVAKEVLNKCMHLEKPSEGSTQHIRDKYEVTFDFEFLDDLYNINKWEVDGKKTKKKTTKQPVNQQSAKSHMPTLQSIRESYYKGRDLVPYTRDSQMFKKNHPMMIMVESSREELLDHPLVIALERVKWTSFGRFFYYFSFIFFCIFLGFLTGCIGVIPPPFEVEGKDLSAYAGDSVCERFEASGEKVHTFAKIGKYFIIILSCYHLIVEAVQLFHGKVYYFTWESLLDISLFVSSILFSVDIETCQAVTGYRMDWQWNFGAIAITLGWLDLLMYIQQFPQLGIYVVMFRYILYTFLMFSVVFLLFIIAFGMGFFALIQNQTPYATPWHAVMRTAVMMIGEFDYNDIFHGDDDMHYWLTYVFMAIFVVIMSIIIMNLLVGLAVDDIKGVQDQAKLKRSAMKVSLVLDVERISLSFTSRYYKLVDKVHVKSSDEATALITPPVEIESQIQKGQMRMLKKIDKVKTGMKQMKHDMAKVEDMLEAIMKAQNIKLDADEIQA